jgi:hypothetical protein
MNHALLPSKTRATLPVKYEAAKLALSECSRIDECKEWADQAMALASYAKQADDKEMEKTAMRIRARAVRRCGELLKEIEKGQGRRDGKWSTLRGTPFRKDIARDAGMSKRQAVTAVRVASISGESFNQQVESNKPPTITTLAEQGKGRGIPHYVQLGMTKKAFQAGMYFRGHLADLAGRTKEFDPQDVVDGSTPKEQQEIRRNIETIDKYLDKLMAKL